MSSTRKFLPNCTRSISKLSLHCGIANEECRRDEVLEEILQMKKVIINDLSQSSILLSKLQK